MEMTISANIMKSLMEDSIKNANNKDYSFIDNRSEEMKRCLQTMESMGVRSIELDLSSDDESLLS
jgi:hypothetical protein